MRLMVLYPSAAKSLLRSTEISLFASVQMAMSSLWRSPSEMSPFSNWASTFAASFSCREMISPFDFGVMTSLSATVTPERVAQWKPASFILSRVAATSTLGYSSARISTIDVMTVLSATSVTYSNESGRSSLKSAFPRVVSNALPGAYPAGASPSLNTTPGTRSLMSALM